MTMSKKGFIYDVAKDVCLWNKEYTEDGKIIWCVTVNSYNNGTPKIGITKKTADKKGNIRFAKFSRMGFNDAINVSNLIKEAYDFIKTSKLDEKKDTNNEQTDNID